MLFMNIKKRYGVGLNTIFFILCFNQVQAQLTYNWNTFTTDNSALQTSLITRLLFFNDTLWIGTDKGLYFFANESLEKENAFPDLFIKALEKGTQGTFWIGTGCDGVYHRKADGEYIAYNSGTTGGNGLLNDCILSLSVGIDSLWVGTEGNGVFLFYNNTWTSYHSGNVPGSPDMNHILDVETTSGNQLWLGTVSSGLIKKAGSLWVVYDSLFGLPSNRVNCITPVNDTIFWLGLGNGNQGNHLVKMDVKNETILQVYDTSVSNGITHQNIWQIFIDSKKRKWIGPNNGQTGLTVYNDTSFYAYNEFEAGLRSLRIYDFEEDDSSRIWAATFRGLSVNTTVFGLDIEEEPLLAVQPVLYPNPVTIGLSVYFQLSEIGDINLRKITLADLTGRIILDDMYNTSGLQIPFDVSPGCYVLSAWTDRQRFSYKLIITN